MKLRLPSSKVILIVKWSLFAAILVTYVMLCIAISSKNAKIRNYKSEVKALNERIEQLNNRCEEYGKMDCITVNATFEVNNKNVFSINTTAANNVMRTYAVYTKDEVLKALDTLQTK